MGNRRAGALGVALVLLGLVFGIELWTETTLGAMRTQVSRTSEVVRCIQELHTRLIEAVAARREHTLSPDARTRAAVADAVNATRHEQSRLRVLAADEQDAQRARLDQLDAMLERALDEVDQADAERSRAAFNLSREQVIDAEEDQATRALGSLLDAIRGAQLQLLAARQKLAQHTSRQARVAEALGVAISVCLLLAVLHRLRLEIALRERSEQALRESESRLGTTLDSIGDGVIVTDTQARVTRMNPVAQRLTGMSFAEALDKPFGEVFPMIDEQTREPAEDPVRRVLRDGIGVGMTNHTALRSRDGSERPVADSAAPIRDPAGNLTGVVMVFRDMSEERRAARRVDEASAFLDSIVENLPNMVFVKEPRELRFVRFNKAGEELLGTPRSALIGKNDFDFFPEQQARFFQEKDRDVLARRTLLDIAEEPIKTPAGERWLHTKKIPILDADGNPRYLLGISEDITEKKATAEELLRAKAELELRVEQRTRDLRAANEELKREMNERKQAEAALLKSESQLRQAQKMEAIGRLAGGVAHDFNNMLSVILSYGDLVFRSLPADSPLRADVEQISQAGARAADLTRQLLAFSRQQVLVPKLVDLNASIESMHKMLCRLIGEDIELRTLPCQDLAHVRVDPGQIEQVIVNLAVNARDAMPQGGILSIETGNVELDSAYAAEHPGIRPGPHVMLAVSDSGLGMDRETQARIFEPFFTTKEQGKGTGLGLSTVFGIVQQSGGSIWVYSELNQGTTFKVYLPRASGHDLSSGLTTARAASANGSETVLLVEDDEQVRTLAKVVLERSGFRVIAACGCEEALRVEASYGEPIQLLLTDVVMPRMSGRELAELLAKQRPRMKVLFMSGYTDDTVVHHGVLEAGVQFLQKPLTPDGLTRKVREVLDLA
jgi:two-component system, cell cycle sensor histidine kinase and response regulator CckA